MKKILLTTVATAIFATSSAYAAEEFYVKAEGAWTKLANVKLINSATTLKSKNSGSFGVGAGYHVMDNVRADLTFTHFINPQHKKDEFKIKGEINTLMLNGFVDVFDITEGAKVFVGAGVGVSQLKAKITENSLTGAAKAKQKYDVAFAGYVGTSYEFAPSMVAELTYSYKNLGKTKKFKNDAGADRLSSVTYKGHNVGLGVRFGL